MDDLIYIDFLVNKVLIMNLIGWLYVISRLYRNVIILIFDFLLLCDKKNL